jgi:hypothetical protein
MEDDHLPIQLCEVNVEKCKCTRWKPTPACHFLVRAVRDRASQPWFSSNNNYKSLDETPRLDTDGRSDGRWSRMPYCR